jgi:hypothetical protein
MVMVTFDESQSSLSPPLPATSLRETLVSRNNITLSPSPILDSGCRHDYDNDMRMVGRNGVLANVLCSLVILLTNIWSSLT